MDLKQPIRDLVGEVQISKADERRKQIESFARGIYLMIVFALFFVALDLYTRPDALMLKLYGAIAAACLASASGLWAWATFHSAAGRQRIFATAFWGLDLVVQVLNVVADYHFHLKQAMPDWLYSWFSIGSIGSIGLALFGLAFYLKFSPGQKHLDSNAEAVALVADALIKGLQKPSDETKATINAGVNDVIAAIVAAAVQNVGGIAVRKEVPSFPPSTAPPDYPEAERVPVNDNHKGEPSPNAQPPRQ